MSSKTIGSHSIKFSVLQWFAPFLLLLPLDLVLQCLLEIDISTQLVVALDLDHCLICFVRLTTSFASDSLETWISSSCFYYLIRVVMKWKFSLARTRVFSHEYSRVRAFFKMTIYNRNFSMFLIVIFRYFFEIAL